MKYGYLRESKINTAFFNVTEKLLDFLKKVQK